MEEEALGEKSLLNQAVQLRFHASVACDVAKSFRTVPLEELVYFHAHSDFLSVAGC
jgi:hypothetical protein